MNWLSETHLKEIDRRMGFVRITFDVDHWEVSYRVRDLVWEIRRLRAELKKKDGVSE